MKTLEVIAVTYGHMPAVLPMFVYSFLAQTSQDYLCRIFHDGPSADGSYEFMREICSKYPDNFSYLESFERGNVYGHQNRQTGLETSSSPLIHMTNCDNYTVPVFVQSVTEAFKQNPTMDVLTFPILHSYSKYHWFEGKAFRICMTDMASFVISNKLAKSAGFTPSNGVSWRKKEDFAADGHFIERVKKANPNLRLGHLDMGMVIHN